MLVQVVLLLCSLLLCSLLSTWRTPVQAMLLLCSLLPTWRTPVQADAAQLRAEAERIKGDEAQVLLT